MSKILNIRIEENATFTKTLSFTRLVEQSVEVNPITSETTRRLERQPLDITGFSFVAQVKDKFENPSFTEDMQVSIISLMGGRISLELTREQTTTIANVAAQNNTGIRNDRTSQIGFYDLLVVGSTGNTTRLLSGEVYLSRGISVGPQSSLVPRAVRLSPISPLTQNLELSVLDTSPSNEIGIRYYQDGVQVVPTAGSVAIFRRPTSTNVFEGTASGTLQAIDASTELTVTGASNAFRAIPMDIVGANSYQIVAVASS